MNTANLRDCGGCPTTDGRLLRKGLIYRSGSLDRMKRQELEGFRSLHITTLVDLRAARERCAGSIPSLAAKAVSLPLDYDTVTRRRVKFLLHRRNAEARIQEVFEGVYREMVDQTPGQLRVLFRILLTADAYPVLIHCQAGKDRTGFVCAVVQRALGIDESHIVRDYLESNENLRPRAERISNLIGRLSLGLFPARNFLTLFTAHERYIRAVLERIDSAHGGIESYLEKCGVTRADLDVLKRLLLVDPASSPATRQS